MIKALRTAASGMVAQQLNIDTIANNLANVNTTGYKKSKVEFQDVLYENVRRAGTNVSAENVVPVNLQVGYGAKPIATVRTFDTGDLNPTDNPLDVAIQGNGFFQVSMPDGTVAYTRDGAFKVSSDGRLVTADGFFMTPEITLPQDTEAISVGIDGRVQVSLPGQLDPQEVGQIELAKFLNPGGLNAIGHNLFLATASSGDAILGNPSENGFGELAQGYLEMANVEVVDEMVNMILAQRAYEINAKAIQTSDDMSRIANELKR
ncbi:MAG: flagellar basal-body rod protein FlgG [candidate division Zixibacteria bacterium]|nr:flagellar basal-body rod protein FlgG [candidate division Zixibacteria bacterium]